MHLNRKYFSGFTLIELLVVISIIGILTALALVSFSTAQKQARDSGRKSDIKQYQTALESFANKNTTYPSKTSAVAPSTLCATLGIAGSCPEDPKNPTMQYKYISDGTGAGNDALNYVLWAQLESQSGSYYVVCSSGKVGTSTTAPTSSSCPI